MAGAKKARKQLSLQSGRPPTAVRPSGSISSKATQKTIVNFHQLIKQLEKAKGRGDDSAITTIQRRIDEIGGIKAYQKASIQGQAIDRGGDSSTVLLKWLEPVRSELANQTPKSTLLEVGALSTQNACSTSGLFTVTRIDLHSQAPAIQKQDFMQRPLPAHPAENFHIISLSLVLNFVPDAPTRGAMLRRTTAFLHPVSSDHHPTPPSTGLLFLVLPAPCLLNSRYCNDEHLAHLMASLGYVLLQRRQTAKLVYLLWQARDRPAARAQQRFPKVKLRDGPGMNNFCIVLE